MKDYKWIKCGALLGVTFFLAIFIVKPIGVSTQFSVLSGIIYSSIDRDVITVDESRESGYKSTNVYFDRNDGKLAKAIKEPLNYDFVFVLAMPVGAFIGYLLTSGRKKSEMSDVGEIRGVPEREQGFLKVYGPSFLSGFVLLYGARLADGCTSGHMMSGMMQGSVSGYIFALGAFLVAIPVALQVKASTEGGFKK